MDLVRPEGLEPPTF